MSLLHSGHRMPAEGRKGGRPVLSEACPRHSLKGITLVWQGSFAAGWLVSGGLLFLYGCCVVGELSSANLLPLPRGNGNSTVTPGLAFLGAQMPGRVCFPLEAKLISSPCCGSLLWEGNELRRSECWTWVLEGASGRRACLGRKLSSVLPVGETCPWCMGDGGWSFSGALSFFGFC